MGRVDKTIFISYRRTNASLAIYQNLTHHGYDAQARRRQGLL